VQPGLFADLDRFFPLLRVFKLNRPRAAPQKVENNRNDRKNQQQMDRKSRDMEDKKTAHPG
jgi:hypothetical protein